MRRVLTYGILAIASFCSIGLALAQDAAVPVRLQFTLFCKALTFDRALESRCGEELVIGLAFQDRYHASRDAMRDVKNEATEKKITEVKGLPLKLVSIDLEDKDWELRAAEQSVDVLYIMPVRAVETEDITKFAQEHHVLTLTAEFARVADGASLGLRLQDNRPKFVINLEASRTEGADFSSQLLSLAEVIK